MRSLKFDYRRIATPAWKHAEKLNMDSQLYTFRYKKTLNN